jgi:hypothetical protein
MKIGGLGRQVSLRASRSSEGHVTNELVGSRPFDPLAMVSAWSVLPCLGFVHPGHQRGGRYE